MVSIGFLRPLGRRVRLAELGQIVELPFVQLRESIIIISQELDEYSGRTGASYWRPNELFGCRIAIRDQVRKGMDGRPAFFQKANDICDHSV